MTREQKLYSMRMIELAEVAEKLGIKIDKKGSKSKAIEKILDAEQTAEVMKQKKELGIECPPIKSVEIVSTDCAGDGTPLAEVGKEIANDAKQKAKDAKSKKPEKKSSAKPKKEKKDSVDTIAFAESICKQMKLEYKRSRDGVGIFVEGKRVIDMWRRSDKVRVYMSSANPKFKKIDKKIVINLNDNPSKSSKLDKSFYVEYANIEKMIASVMR